MTGTDELTEQWRRRADRVLPGGVSSNVRLSAPRRVFARAQGARLWDVDGREYVDYLLGQGPAFLGHANPHVLDAVSRATANGMVYGAQHRLEITAAEKVLSAVTWADQVRFGVSGTEAVQAALRLARAVTGRRLVVRFSGSYHGWLDNVLMTFEGERTRPASAGQLAEHLVDWLVLPYNDAAAVEEVFDRHPDGIAAVIVEPVMCNSGVIPPCDDFLARLRESCNAHEAVLIFDEVITGFRIALGGAAEYYRVEPDLAVYGKALAGGWPVSALVGRQRLMRRIGTGEVNHSGTFNGSVMAAAAVDATLDVLISDPPYQRVAEHSAQLMDGLRDVAARHGAAVHVQGVPGAFHVSFTTNTTPALVRNLADLDHLDLDRYARFADLLAEHGVWLARRGVWYVSATHGDTELVDTLARVDHAFGRIEP